MIDQARLAECVGRLDAGTRALLDLSLRRAIPDEQVASVLGVDAASIPPRRARGIAELADMMEVPGPSELAALLIAIPELPESAWGVPIAAPAFSGQVSRARRARAFRRTAVAASPLVALGAVIAAIAVSAGSDNGAGGGASAGAGARAGAAGHAANGPQASIFTPAPRHGLPAGVPLTPARSGKAKHSHAERAAARRRRARRHLAAGAQQAVAVREHSSAPRTERVVFHQPAPAPVIHTHPRHVTHHHAPAAPKPGPAPHTSPPSTPVSAPPPAPPPAPAPVQQPNSTVQESAPSVQVVSDAPSSSGKESKPSVPQPTGLRPPESSGDEGHGCGGRHSEDDSRSDDHSEEHSTSDHHSQDHSRSDMPSRSDDGDDDFPGRGHHYGRLGAPGHAAGGRPFTPPGLFKKRSGLHH